VRSQGEIVNTTLTVEQDLQLVQQALNDWLRTFADSEFDESEVEAARKRLMVYGTIGYIANATAALRRVRAHLSPSAELGRRGVEADARHTPEQRRMVEWYTKRLAAESQTCGWGLDKRGEDFVATYAQIAWDAWLEATRPQRELARLLGLVLTKYEDAESCYEDPGMQVGFIGKTIHLSHEDEVAIVSALEAHEAAPPPPPADVPPVCDHRLEVDEAGNVYRGTRSVMFAPLGLSTPSKPPPPADATPYPSDLADLERFMLGTDPPADVQAVAGPKVTDPQQVLELWHKYAKPNTQGYAIGYDEFRSAIALLQRPFSEELRQAMLAGAKSLHGEAKAIQGVFKSTRYREEAEADIAIKTQQAALLTRAAEAKEKP
jgi:hypothetical protein